MKVWNKPIRFGWCSSTEIFTMEGLEPFNPWKDQWGVTNWFVGHCDTIWQPWIQFHFGRLSIQIKWYIIVPTLMIMSFITGILL